MPFAHSTAQDILKEDYKPVVRGQLNNKFVILDLATQNEDDVEGIEAVLSTHQGRNKGVGARGAFQQLPTAGAQSYKKSRIPLKRNYATIKVEGYLVRMARSDRGSFVRAVESEIKGAVVDLRRDVNRQCYTPASGQIAATAGSPTATSVAVATTAQARRLEPGYRYDIVEAASDLVVRTIDLTSVNVSTKTLTYTTALVGTGTAASGNRIVNTGVTPSESLEITGIESIVDSSGSIFGIDPASYPRWASYEEAVSGLPTDSVFEKAADEVHLACGEDIDLVITSHEVARTFAQTQKGSKRFTTEPTVLKGGFSAVTVTTPTATFALRAERDCETAEAYGLTTAKLIHYKASDWEWMDEDGAVLFRSDGQDAYEATAFRYHELATDQRNAHFKLTGLTTV